MISQIFQRFGDRRLVRCRHRLVDHVAAERAHQRHRFRGAERQVETVHTALAVGPSALPRGRHTGVQPARHDVGIGVPTGPLRVGQPHQIRDRPGVPGARPHRGPGVAFGVILRQPTTGRLGVLGGLADRAGGVVVVVHRPQRQLRDRQHPHHPHPVRAARRGPRKSGFTGPPADGFTSIAQNLCKCAKGLSGVEELSVGRGRMRVWARHGMGNWQYRGVCGVVS